MSTQLLTQRYQDRPAGVLLCYDRIVIGGTPPNFTRAPVPQGQSM